MLGNTIIDIFPDLFPTIGSWLRGLFGIAESTSPPRIDPLVLDLSGNGFKPTSLQDGVNFDMD